MLILAFDTEPHEIELDLGGGSWHVLLDSDDGDHDLDPPAPGEPVALILPARCALVLGS